MKLKIILISILIVFVSCKKSDKIVNNSKEFSKLNKEINDTIVIENSDLIVFISPNDHEIENLKKKYGEDDFYIIADDVSSYLALATEKLDNNNIKYIQTTSSVIYFKKESIYINKSSLESEWSIVYMDYNNKSKSFSPIDFNIEDVLFKIQKPILSNKWYGLYTVEFNDKNKDWNEIVNITLEIKKDSILYEETGYQDYSVYNLKGDLVNNKLLLTYVNRVNGLESAVLEKTKDFGELWYDGKNYKWTSSYIDIIMNDGKKQTYILNKK